MHNMWHFEVQSNIMNISIYTDFQNVQNVWPQNRKPMCAKKWYFFSCPIAMAFFPRPPTPSQTMEIFLYFVVLTTMYAQSGNEYELSSDKFRNYLTFVIRSSLWFCRILIRMSLKIPQNTAKQQTSRKTFLYKPVPQKLASLPLRFKC